MNKVYQFSLIEEYDTGWIYIAAKTWKEAAKYARQSDYLSNTAENFIDYRGHLVKPIVKTEYTDELEIDQIIELNLHWFECPECGSRNVSLVKESIDDKYKCNECGEIETIPYYDN
jgi:predicted RNA-binding Zn-ribbon protein involved in translation (DUF1610 family)